LTATRWVDAPVSGGVAGARGRNARRAATCAGLYRSTYDMSKPKLRPGPRKLARG
jgi:3-hydroxyisobutyrate dehydrogenase-like beta-hydroxyacid dehydrogenase